MPSPACLTIDLDALAANYRLIGARAGGAAVAPVVKAGAYGLGLEPVVQRLSREGARDFFIARIEEGRALRAVLPGARIFVLDGLGETPIAAFRDADLIPVLSTPEDVARWRAQGAGAPCALHADTGLNRLGLPLEDAQAALSARHALNPVLLMSHLACADTPGHPMNAEQRARFAALRAQAPDVPASLAASGAVHLGADFAFDMVRPGIALFGGAPSDALPNPMAQVVRLTAPVLQLRRVDRGEAVGYAAAFRSARPGRLAILGIGYADGLARAAAGGYVTIAGHRAPFAGRISMDLATVDVSDLPDAVLAAAHEAEIFGTAPGLDEHAAMRGTISYEVLTGIGPRVARVHRSGDAAS